MSSRTTTVSSDDDCITTVCTSLAVSNILACSAADQGASYAVAVMESLPVITTGTKHKDSRENTSFT